MHFFYREHLSAEARFGVPLFFSTSKQSSYTLAHRLYQHLDNRGVIFHKPGAQSTFSQVAFSVICPRSQAEPLLHCLDIIYSQPAWQVILLSHYFQSITILQRRRVHIAEFENTAKNNLPRRYRRDFPN